VPPDERERKTRDLALAVLNDDLDTAKHLAEEILRTEPQPAGPTEHFTDKKFCSAFKINRSTSASWRELGIVGYLKLPNGQIRYSQEHINALTKQCEKKSVGG
jgi:hypothetical protein